MSNGQKVEFEIECHEFPCATLSPYAHLRLGIQERNEVRQDVACTPCPEEGVRFRFTLEAMIDPASHTVTFRGGYAQGPRNAQFVYLCWGAWGEDGWQHFRRAQLPLGGLDVALVERALRAARPIRVRVRMTDAKGEPATAMLKPEQMEWLG